MSRLKIGLRIDCLRLPLRQAVRKAAELGVQGVQVNAVGDLHPDRLSATGQRDLRHFLNSLGLELAALGFPTRHGFSAAEGLDARIEAAKKVLTLSYQLQAPIVTGPIGRVPEDTSHPARQLLSDAITELARHAERVGAVFAVETGPESGATLRRFIDSLGGAGVRASLDPANLLVKGYDPVQSVRDLNECIVHAHARDAVREAGGELGREATPGDGDLDWQEYLGALEEVGYRGWLVIQREQADDPAREIARAVSFLRRLAG
jgi:sugar phosphate isomerase/epimerase